MAERRDNSVLFSLSELRRIEEDRVKQEESEAQARIVAEQRAREEVERKAREAEEAKVRQQEELAMRERLEREKMSREEGMRLQEAERKARVEADAKLQHERMRLEIQAQAIAPKHPPLKAIAAGVGVLLLIVAGLGWYMYQKHLAEQAHQQGIINQQNQALAAEKKAREEEQRQFSLLTKQIEDAKRELGAAKTEAERARIQARIEEAERSASKLKSTRSTSAPGSSGKGTLNIGPDTNDPLKGL